MLSILKQTSTSKLELGPSLFFGCTDSGIFFLFFFYFATPCNSQHFFKYFFISLWPFEGSNRTQRGGDFVFPDQIKNFTMKHPDGGYLIAKDLGKYSTLKPYIIHDITLKRNDFR